MNGQNLLIGLSYIDRKFIEESEQDILGKNAKRLSAKKLWLIAAVIALVLLLMGCAMVAYARIHVKLVQHNPAHTVQPFTEIQNTESVKDFESVKNVLTDCYPQSLPDGYLLGDGSPLNYTTRHISYYNAAGQMIRYSLSTSQEPDLVLAPPREETSLKVSHWDAELHVSAKGGQMLKWHNTEDGYYGCLFTQDMSVDLKPIAESVDYGEPLPLSFLCKQGQLWDVWYPQQIPQGYRCTDVSPAENGVQSICYTCDTEHVISYRVSLKDDLVEISDLPNDSGIWEELTIGGQPAKLLTTGSGLRLLFWKNEKEGFNAMLSVDDDAVDIIGMAESAAPGVPLEVSTNYLGSDYTIELEQEPSAYVGWEPVYPQKMPEGYEIAFVSERAYGQQNIDYKNAAGNSISFTLYFRMDQRGKQFDGMGQPEIVDINGNTGYLSDNLLIWTDETKGFGFTLASDGDVDLVEIAKSVGIGAELKPTNADWTEQALKELGDYQITSIPEGMMQDGLTGCPLAEGDGWYSYVRRWYFSHSTNQEIYFEYESYVADDSSIEDVARMYAGQGDGSVQLVSINGCTGATLQNSNNATVVWVIGDGTNGIQFRIFSDDYSVDDLLSMAESVQKR